jgi:hypothetical protein
MRIRHFGLLATKALPLDPPTLPAARTDAHLSPRHCWIARVVRDDLTAARYNPHNSGRFSSTNFMRSATGASGKGLTT